VTNSDLTLIAFLVDRSGSMASCKDDMQGGLNTLIKTQRKEPGKAEVALAQFDTEYEILWQPQSIKKVGKYELHPRGSTALLDGMGRFITEIGESLAKRDEEDRPGKVIMCIVTDGYENSSKDWNREQVRKLVQKQRDQWQWEFVFLGANMDAVKEGASLGIQRDTSITYTPANASNVYASTSSLVSNYRVAGAAAANFTDSDRKNAVTTP
jgi:uncharacterized protein YegL